MTQIIILFKFNAEGVVPIIAQGWRQPTLGYACCVEVNAVGVVRFLRGTTPSVLRFFVLNCH
ncbi:6,7-dimethyl-8-ribityllumazine synthase subunit [Segatella salivae]|uniref:6,7-dimethyl-8-ribityllumazine synthase subunit n=1 Tax=Segatella salivae TaxID=228604 RepID=UPI0021516B5C|nr:6,7-dimethyl-8-ribityllumazine synthase subunit [Segatella salivae]